MRSQDSELYSKNLVVGEPEDESGEQFGFFCVDEEIVSLIPCTVKGLNSAEGIKNAGGKPDQYVEVLRLFCIESSVIAENLSAYYKHNRKMFGIKLHGIRNSCYCVGAVELGEKAAEIMDAVEEQKNVSGQLDCFTKELCELINGIGEYLTAIRNTCEKAKGEDRRKVCQIPGIPREKALELHSAIDNFDLELSMELLDDIRKKRYSDEIEYYLNRLSDLCEQFEFAEAAELLEKVTEPL